MDRPCIHLPQMVCRLFRQPFFLGVKDAQDDDENRAQEHPPHGLGQGHKNQGTEQETQEDGQ